MHCRLNTINTPSALKPKHTPSNIQCRYSKKSAESKFACTFHRVECVNKPIQSNNDTIIHGDKVDTSDCFIKIFDDLTKQKCCYSPIPTFKLFTKNRSHGNGKALLKNNAIHHKHAKASSLHSKAMLTLNTTSKNTTLQNSLFDINADSLDLLIKSYHSQVESSSTTKAQFIENTVTKMPSADRKTIRLKDRRINTVTPFYKHANYQSNREGLYKLQKPSHSRWLTATKKQISISKYKKFNSLLKEEIKKTPQNEKKQYDDTKILKISIIKRKRGQLILE